MFFILRENAFINGVIDKWTILFEIEIQFFK